MRMKFVFRVSGKHIVCAVHSADEGQETFAYNGGITFTPKEAEHFKRILVAANSKNVVIE